jgi:hypothetical protein
MNIYALQVPVMAIFEEKQTFSSKKILMYRKKNIFAVKP